MKEEAKGEKRNGQEEEEERGGEWPQRSAEAKNVCAFGLKQQEKPGICCYKRKVKIHAMGGHFFVVRKCLASDLIAASRPTDV
jgi:hypothetical protein